MKSLPEKVPYHQIKMIAKVKFYVLTLSFTCFLLFVQIVKLYKCLISIDVLLYFEFLSNKTRNPDLLPLFTKNDKRPALLNWRYLIIKLPSFCVKLLNQFFKLAFVPRETVQSPQGKELQENEERLKAYKKAD